MAHPLIEKYLLKVGIKSAEQLQPEEKIAFDKWQKILSKDELKLEDVQAFCVQQKSFIEAQFDNLENSKEKALKLTLLHSVYAKLLAVMEGNKAEREALEKYLTYQIDNIPSKEV